ncbi:hypothetical protein N9K77_01580 [bacterium]|nr:hypothetical protein [bacterium]
MFAHITPAFSLEAKLKAFEPLSSGENEDECTWGLRLANHGGAEYSRKKLDELTRAHQQIKFEELKQMYENGEVLSQKLLLPIEVELNPSDFVLCMEIKEELERLGVEIDQTS